MSDDEESGYSMSALRVQFICQEQSHLRSKWPNPISNYVAICLFAQDIIIFWKIASLQKDSQFYVHDKTIHSLAKYIIMDYFDQEDEKSRHLLV